MKRTRLLLLPALLASAFLCGCIIPIPVPGKEEVSPEISGRIIDGKTKQPVVGAQVEVVDSPWSPGSRKSKGRPKTITDDQGRFKLPADKHFYLMSFATPCPTYHFPPVGEDTDFILISHPDYEALRVNLVDYVLSGKRIQPPEIGDIEIVTKQ